MGNEHGLSHSDPEWGMDPEIKPPEPIILYDHRILRYGLITGSLVSLALVAFGLSHYLQVTSAPGAHLAFAAIIIFVTSLPGTVGLAYTRSRRASSNLAIQRGTSLGLVLGIIWFAQIIAARLVLSGNERQSTGLALIAIAGIGTAILAIGSAYFSSRRTGRIYTGLQVGLWGGVIAGLAAFIAVLALAYLLVNSRLNEEQVLQAFHLSGEKEPAAWFFWDQLSAAAGYLLLSFGLSASASLLGALSGFIWYSPKNK